MQNSGRAEMPKVVFPKLLLSAGARQTAQLATSVAIQSAAGAAVQAAASTLQNLLQRCCRRRACCRRRCRRRRLGKRYLLQSCAMVPAEAPPLPSQPRQCSQNYNLAELWPNSSSVCRYRLCCCRRCCCCYCCCSCLSWLSPPELPITFQGRGQMQFPLLQVLALGSAGESLEEASLWPAMQCQFESLQPARSSLETS